MIQRKEYLEKLYAAKELQLIKVVTGIRRCGKSTLLKQFQDYLRSSGVGDEQIIAINFEELENERLLDRRELYEFLKSRLCKGKFTYIFLDEIQKVDEFEKVVDSLYVKENVDLYLTGSNAYILSGELATFLSGRYIEINMLPLSFKEYREFMGGDDRGALFSEYLNGGSLPYAAKIRKNKIDVEEGYIEGIYNTVFVKDIEERMKRREKNSSERTVTDIPLLKTMAKYLSGVIGSPVSVKAIADYLTSAGRKISHNTIDVYLAALEESYLFYKAERMDVEGKQILKQSPKYYMVDLGFRRHILPKKNYDIGFSLENAVYFELLRRGYTVNIGKVGQSEVDFVATKAGTTEYYQVTASLLDETTFNREVAPLKKIKDNYNKTVLTLDGFGLGNYNGINVVNVIDWLG